MVQVVVMVVVMVDAMATTMREVESSDDYE
jgi:hypothetical protein